MSRIVVRSVILTLTIILALVIANVGPKYLDQLIGADGNIRALIVVGILVLIVVLIAVGNIVSHRIKSSRNEKNIKH